jgi:D-proline reductase (dithiol) PrdB
VCHQSVGLIARHIEAAGMPTIGFTSARTITASANPPRSVFVDLPLGHTTGLPNDAEGQRRLLTEGLHEAVAISEPGAIVDLPYRFVDDEWKANPLGWSRKRQSSGAASKPSGDSRTGRSDEPRYQNDDDRVAAEAVSWDDQCLTCIGLG